MGRAIDDIVAMSARLPRGNDAYWQLILEVDREGAWSIASIAARCDAGINRSTIRDFVRRLELGGVAVRVGEDIPSQAAFHGGTPRITYRLVKHPAETPRFDRQGVPMSEPTRVTLWRSIRMAKRFSVTELAEAAGVKPEAARRYVAMLASVGIVARVSVGPEYQLRLDIGPKAPQVLRARQLIFDPNSRVVIGTPLLAEVAR
ncbi:conserved hypothetical protein [Devosia sp. DBB001]|nr:conserved hypothetical protein [Devosia sp. DBB001]